MSPYPTSSVMISTTLGRSAGCACTSPACPRTVATTSQRALRLDIHTARIVDASLWPVRTLLENRAQRVELRGIHLANLHWRDRYIAVVHGVNVRAVRGGAAFLVDIPVHGAARGRVRRLGKAFLAAALHRLGRNAISAIPA